MLLVGFYATCVVLNILIYLLLWGKPHVVEQLLDIHADLSLCILRVLAQCTVSGKRGVHICYRALPSGLLQLARFVGGLCRVHVLGG